MRARMKTIAMETMDAAGLAALSASKAVAAACYAQKKAVSYV